MIRVTTLRSFHRRKDILVPDDATLSIRYRDSIQGPVFFIRSLLKDKWSVITVLREESYYASLQDVMPTSTIRFSYKNLSDELKRPWIAGLSPSAVNAQEETMRTLMRMPVSTGTEPLMPDPFDRQSYYEVEMKGSKTEQLFCEALLCGLFEQFNGQTPAVNTAILMDAPFKPRAKKTADCLEEAINNGLQIVYMYENSGKEYDAAEFSLWSDNKNIMFKDSRKCYRLAR